MHQTRRTIGRFCLTLAIGAGMTALTAMAAPRAADQPEANTASQENQGTAVSRAEARAAQRKLKDDGLYQGKVDGVLGPETRAALRRYQEQNNLNAGGRLTRETAESLGVARTGAYFETAGSSIRNNYKDAGSDVTHGATGAANRFKQGEVGSGFDRFGRGMWHGIKAVGAGTADAAKDAYHGTRHAFMGNR